MAWSCITLASITLDINLGHEGIALYSYVFIWTRGTNSPSPHMIPKQLEMDGIVKQIYQSIETEEHLHSTLFVLCGDHGMNEAGNHGGSAEGETSPALVFMSPKFQPIFKGSECPLALPDSTFSYYTMVEQSDIAPTLAGLLGFPIPLNSLGVFIPDLLGFWDEGW